MAASLDILILQDFTGSQIPYIESVRKGVNDISAALQSRFPTATAIRYGLVAFRDHPPQDETFVTKVHPFSTRPGDLADNLASLSATGGGDGPECQSCALRDAFDARWRRGATKVAILITDSPPHGIEKYGDGFPKGCPEGIDPLQIGRQMRVAGIKLYVLACEPTLSQYYKNARDFYVGLTGITGGGVYDLGDPEFLPRLISGIAIQAFENECLVTQYIDEVHSLAKNGQLNPDDIANKLLSELQAKGVTQHVLVVDDMHIESSKIVKNNVDIWLKAEATAEARARIQEVKGDRIKRYFLSGGLQSAPEIKELPIDLVEVQSIVQKCLSRN